MTQGRNDRFDVAVLGAGAAGMMCAAVAGQRGARVVLVGLGCPKQESWMASCRGSVPAVMLGLGAAFDFHAGVLARAPKWVQRAGMEWAYRWAQEPRRLSRRYLSTNVPFLLWAARLLTAVGLGHVERFVERFARGRNSSDRGTFA